jgi:hypothetical protein
MVKPVAPTPQPLPQFDRYDDAPPRTVPFFVRSITIIGSLFVSAVLIGMLIIGCKEIKELECTWTNIPYISDIAKYKFYDRFFLFALTTYAFVIVNFNIRANYTLLYDHIKMDTN